MRDNTIVDQFLDGGFALGADPLPDETQIGFVARLAERQRLYTTHTLMAKLGFGSPTNRFHLAYAQRLARVAGTDLERIRAITIQRDGDGIAVFRGRRLPARVFDFFGAAFRRACPSCLAESPHHRCWWDIQVVSACPAHGLALVDRCYRCDAPLRWLYNGVRTTSCSCRAEISSFDAPQVSRDERGAVALLQGLLGDERFADVASEWRTKPPFADLDDAASADFMIRFALDLLGRRRKRFSSLGSLDLARRGHEGLAMVVAAICRWPGSFEAALDGIRSGLNPGHPPSRRSVAAPMIAWLDGLPAGQGRLLRKALEAWRHE